MEGYARTLSLQGKQKKQAVFFFKCFFQYCTGEPSSYINLPVSIHELSGNGKIPWQQWRNEDREESITSGPGCSILSFSIPDGLVKYIYCLQSPGNDTVRWKLDWNLLSTD